MKRTTWLVGTTLLFITIATYMTQLTSTIAQPHTSSVLDTEGKPTNHLLILLDILHLKHNGTLPDIVEKTQKEWLRAAGKERWQVDEILSSRKAELLPLFKQLGCYDEVVPSQSNYEYLILLGATAHRMWTRLAYAGELWNKRIRFNHIVLLGSERPLDPTIESPETLRGLHDPSLPKRSDQPAALPLPMTEAQAFEYIFNHVALPDSLLSLIEKQSISVTIINSPMRTDSNGMLRRPTTGDTIFDWLRQYPIPGSCLLISNQPYVSYQHSVACTHFPQEWHLETVGQGANNAVRIVELLDTLARMLYQENIRLTAHNKK